jgi:RecB family exonuclease
VLVAANYHKVKVSVTLLNNFYECPWKWYFRNFLQLPESLSESLQFGSVVHSTIEEILKSKKIPKEKELGEIIQKYITENHIIDPSVSIRIQRQALGVVASFVQNAIPELYERYESERPLSYKDPEIPTLSITGKIDLIEYDEAGQVRVTDFKTGKTRTKNEIEKIDDEERLSSYLRQLAMYSYLLERTGKGRVEVGKSRLYFVEDKSSASALYETYITSEHIDLLVRDMKEYDALMQSGEWTERQCHFKPWGSGETECPYCKMGKMYLSR